MSEPRTDADSDPVPTAEDQAVWTRIFRFTPDEIGIMARYIEVPPEKVTRLIELAKYFPLERAEAAGLDVERLLMASTSNLIIAFRRWCKRMGVEPPTVEEYRAILDEAAAIAAAYSEASE